MCTWCLCPPPRAALTSFRPPSPRSGDHTVKITSCNSGALSRVLTGHRRTPWVVRFHPRNPALLASGSLDHEVRLWDAGTGQCVAKHTFGKPIASLAFHVAAPVLAVACGHKLYTWEYATAGAAPVIVLRTRRSMRAVHFHPHGAPVVLTAEVQDQSPTPDLPPTLTHGVAYVAAEEGGAECSQGPGTEAAPGAEAPFAARPLPPSMVPIGREVPFPALVPGPPPAPGSPVAAAAAVAAAGGAAPADGYAAQLAAAYNDTVWNVYSEEQPPRVRLRLWAFDPDKPGAELCERRGVLLQVNDAVLCSEMGVHFSPCGRYMAATVACRAPFPEAAAAAMGRAFPAAAAPPDPAPAASAGAGAAMDWEGSAPAPTAPGPPPQRVVYEVRVACLEGVGGVGGRIARARRVRAAHCLTSVQFSPTGDHLLLAYGKKHSSLLRSLVVDGGSLAPLHTILEVVRLADMGLVRVLPSVEDEINAACFHPLPGVGLAYGTKEGRLRLVGADRGGEEGPPGGEPPERDIQVPEMVLLEQGWMLLQQAFERDTTEAAARQAAAAAAVPRRAGPPLAAATALQQEQDQEQRR